MSAERHGTPAVRHADASAGVAGSPGATIPAEDTSGESRSALFEEEIGRTNQREKAIARHPVCAYIAARFGSLPFVMLLALSFEFARRNTGSFAVICWISFAFFTLVIVEPYWTHHVWARRTKLRREVVDGWRQGEVRAHEEAERLVRERDGQLTWSGGFATLRWSRRYGVGSAAGHCCVRCRDGGCGDPIRPSCVTP